MEYREARSKKLSFKGEAKCAGQGANSSNSDASAKRKSKKRHRESKDEVSHGAAGWVPVESLDDLEGPISLYHRDEQLYIIATPSKEAQVDLNEQAPALYVVGNASLMESEPLSAEQVFAARRSVPMAGPADAEAAMFSLKSFAGTYLSADRHGRVSCASAAIGALEMWSPVLLPDRGDGAVAFMIHPPGLSEGRFLSADTGNTAAESSQGGMAKSTQPARLHASGTSIGYSQVFFAKCQAAIKQKRFQSIQGGRPRSAVGHGMPDIGNAKLAGKDSESLLDRREKAKSDRYCK
ncbi:hypothetical protein GGH91_000325 [Coemansia sp. RSA 2671]|uniref:Uncharacterized protein n=1 Tax=Coemansia linderi TaxID=2663919 RepID=A0ACC1KCX8_9FUNG|nr:hypothetical protein LPJ60_003432 [Coemansia sp. RSA 2675]KAJ2024189.1 hypothetical protein GGI06_001099 [Coemansia sp. S85]KAJ2350157.1 hypothetical protein GGH91_000325 [Coemansia sp. RSA 2671]KAJ2382105.1 hypothetical protein H4S02_005903 [Coemansia sp. RSA 2611]KAJ2417068.1 hypothetical protein GGI10_000462 [Coemansia sp. RSA 2530]KAJ2697636.1 hypothetical protein H4218_003845 [Coemansia sp. IMI 209128]KAJ2786702.1 hypothetical protein GGI18_003230 [Coemansia linderi]